MPSINVRAACFAVVVAVFSFLVLVADGDDKDTREKIEQRRRLEQAAILQQLMMAVSEAKKQRRNEDKVDGEATETKGPCDCGYRHWCEGREVDFVYPIETNRGTKILGYSLTGTLILFLFTFLSKSSCLGRNDGFLVVPPFPPLPYALFRQCI